MLHVEFGFIACIEHPCISKNPCMSGWNVMPLMSCLGISVMVSFHKPLRTSLHCTLPGSALGIRTRILQWSNEGSLPV